ncbi:hypothetical protein CDAR_542841 [Caerostris darwini]|uniref:Uncharacterized protein n=1 Tax=Caerostris darwini TaxID=1538125 RepID=A0AAV4N2C3_9ARAC|nr:hypothetical protein CDAR_542841 [Caerostris darwini]
MLPTGKVNSTKIDSKQGSLDKIRSTGQSSSQCLVRNEKTRLSTWDHKSIETLTRIDSDFGSNPQESALESMTQCFVPLGNVCSVLCSTCFGST